MLPAIERRSGRSRYASATLSSSTTATRCSPTSTEIRSSRLAGGNGGRLGGVRRRGARCLRAAGRRSPATSVLGSRRVWVFGLASVSALVAACVEVVPDGRLRPRPPRLPRRRFLGAVSVWPACAGGVVTFSGGAGAAGSAVRARSSVGDLVRLNSRSKRNLLVGRARYGRPMTGG